MKLFDHTTDLVVQIGGDGRIEAVSRSVERALHFDVADLLGQSWEHLLHPDDRTAPTDGRRRFRVRDAEGLWRWCDLVAAEPDGVGGSDTAMIVFRDAGHALESARFAAMLRRLTEMANTTSQLDWALAAAVRDIRTTMGWTHGRTYVVQGDHDAVLSPVGEWDPSPHDVLPVGRELVLEASRTGQPTTIHVSHGTVELQYVALPVQGRMAISSVLLFVTETPEPLSSTFTAAMANIGSQLGLVADRDVALHELERREQELARSNAELERFAYVASHDLQEPLRKVVTACELLERRFGHLLVDQPDAQSYVTIAVDAAHRMQGLIRDLLAYSRLGRGEHHAEPVDLTMIVRQVVEDMSSELEDAGATVDVPDLPTVRSTPQQMRQVIENLLSNALKFRSDHPPVVSFAWTDSLEQMVHLTITDNGIGVEPQFADQIFDVFRRLHRQDEYPGTGIGLAVVKRIVEQHGGRVWTSTPPDGGVCFHLLLPDGAT